MYFADTGAATPSADRTAKMGTASPACDIEINPTTLMFVVGIAVMRGIGDTDAMHAVPAAQPSSVSAARHIVWRPALVESIV